jgi:phasin family protein
MMGKKSDDKGKKAKTEPKAKPATKAKAAATSAAEKIAEPIKKATTAVRASAGRAVANSVAINTKVIDHAEANAHEAFAAMRKVAGATSVQDVVKVQTEFVKQQGARSAAQVREVGDMIAAFGRDALAIMRGK